MCALPCHLAELSDRQASMLSNLKDLCDSMLFAKCTGEEDSFVQLQKAAAVL